MSGSGAKAVIDNGPMRLPQWVAIAIMVGLNGIDGLDILSISFAAPGIAREWSVSPAMLGWVLSMELLGMAVGSLLLGGIADRIGRRRTILLCLTIMTTGMWITHRAPSVDVLLASRVFTGLGLGGMLSAITAATAEFSSTRRRNLAMGLMVIGYPLAGALGGMLVKAMLASGSGWRDIFLTGTVATAAFIPLTLAFVPETPAFLERLRRLDALAKVNKALGQLGHPPILALAPVPIEIRSTPLASIFQRPLLATTLLVTLAYFAHMTTFYFILKWTTKIVVDAGFTPGEAAGVLGQASLGGALGGSLFGLVADRIGLRSLTMATLCGAGLAVIWFGWGEPSLAAYSLEVFTAGFFCNAAVAGIYMLIAKVFPTKARATGTGFVIGAGRGAAALSPVFAGLFLQAGMSVQAVALVMSACSVLAIFAVACINDVQAD